MSLRHYYRCHNAQAVAAVDEFFKARNALHAKVRAFVERFGGSDGLFYLTFEMQFSAIQFTRSKPPQNEHLWTKATKNGGRWPKRNKDPAVQALRAEYEEHFPKDIVSYAPWMNALGLENGLGGHPALKMVEAKEGAPAYLVLMSNAPITVEGTVEITATEYEKETKE